MKKHLLTIPLLLTVLVGNAQNFNLSWAKQFGGPADMTSMSVATDPTGAIITCGTFEGLVDFDPSAGSALGSSVGAKDAYISKLDASGNFIWFIAFGSPNDDYAYDISTNVNGDVYVTGEFRSTVNFNPNGTAFNLTAPSGLYAFVAKYSSTGEFQWAKKFGDSFSGTESGRSIAIDNFGNVVSAGRCQGIVDFDPGTGVSEVTMNGGAGCYLLKLTSNGDFAWVKSFAGYYNMPTELVIDNDNNIFSAGVFNSTVDFDPGNTTYNLVGQSIDTYIVKLTGAGNFIWAKHFSSISGTVKTTNIMIAQDGSVYAVGGFDNTTDFNPDLVATETITNTTYYAYRAFLVKLDADGLFQYVKQLTPDCNGFAYGLGQDDDGNIYISGNFKGTSDFNPDASLENIMTSVNAYDDIFLSKFNNEGQFQNSISVGGTEPESVSGMLVNPVNALVTLSGNFKGSCDFDPDSGESLLTSAGLYDGYIARFVLCAPSNTVVDVNACGSYNFNGNFYTESGTYSDVLTNANGCDSLVTINLTINGDSYGNVELYALDSIEYNGVTYTADGNYVQVEVNAVGCDSLVYVFVDIFDPSFQVILVDGVDLGTTQMGNSYQWVDCDNNNAAIPNAQSASYTPTESGSYAVIVYGENGSVMSDCFEFTLIQLDELPLSGIDVFPNPFQHSFCVKKSSSEICQLELRDLQGRLIIAQNMTDLNTIVSTSGLPSGIYMLQVRSSAGIRSVKLIKE